MTHVDLIRDTLALLPKLPRNLSAVVGVARSGMIPASHLSTHLHLPLYALNEDGIFNTGHGWRLQNVRRTKGSYLIVDDTLMTGRSLQQAQQVWANRCADRQSVWAVVYRNPVVNQQRLDVWSVDLLHPHLLEWNLFNSCFVAQMAFDFDGILCEDGTGSPKYLPRGRPIPLIVTGRSERSREGSLRWLASHGVSVQRLVMWPADRSETTDPVEIGRFKAKHFARSGLTYFVESCPKQAQEIAALSGKVVICPSAGKVF